MLNTPERVEKKNVNQKVKLSSLRFGVGPSQGGGGVFFFSGEHFAPTQKFIGLHALTFT